jgi:hypothetical protein|tara:strand:- start:49 stop:282 length:234 start_codon:yes stop_codon:yes gene_type:complete
MQLEYEKKEVVVTPQKFSWKEKKRFSKYEDASSLKSSLLKEGHKKVKIRRCGPEGSQFKVVVGTEVKTNKKGKNNAN